MTLDPHPSAAELLARKAQLEREGRSPIVRLPSGTAIVPGPNSPLLPDGRSNRGATPAVSRRGERRDNQPTEHQLQVALFARIEDPAEQLRRPALALVHAIPNGGHRSPAVAAKLKAEGVKAGVLDIDCPVARGGYIGLRIEMKRPGGTTSPEQSHWLAAFAREGHKVALHTTVDGAWAELVNYLDQPRSVVLADRAAIA